MGRMPFKRPHLKIALPFLRNAGPLRSNPAARNDARVIGVVGFAHGTSHFFHLLLPPLFPWLMRDFSLNFTQVGALMSIFFIVSGIGQALAGFAVDRLG